MTPEEWDDVILKGSKEVWDHGEGIAIFKVTNETGKRMWKVELTKVIRGVDKKAENVS